MPLEGHIYTADDGRVWDLDAMTRTDPDGSVHPRSEWTDEERAAVDQWVAVALLEDIFQTLWTLIDSMELIRQEVIDDVAAADARQGDIVDWQAAQTALAASIRDTTPAVTVAYLTALRDQVANAATRDAQIAEEIKDYYAWRSTVDQWLWLISRCVVGLARLATRTPAGDGG